MTNQEISLHGTLMNVFGVGTLITGDPGMGKSELALSLLYRHHQFIADDTPYFHLEKSQLLGRNPLEKYFLSIRGIGIIDVALLFGPTSIKKSQNLDLIIHLERYEASPFSHVEGEHSIKDILGCLIPSVTIPIINPRNLEVLVETIVKNYLLKINNKMSSAMNFEEMLHQKLELTSS